MQEIVKQSDVLVVGGGAAALFAAIKAKEAGADVILVDKGGAGYSGQSPYADGFLSMEKGVNIEDCITYNRMRGEYISNVDYIRLVYSNCEARFADILEWGGKAWYNDDGSFYKLGTAPSAGYNLQGMEMPLVLRKRAKKIGVTIIDSVMITELLTKDGRVVGAVGMSAVEADFYEFHAKAVILCTGASTLKPYGWPCHNLTGDGDAMAYRVGASIMGKEFTDGHSGRGETPHHLDSLKKYSVKKKTPPGSGDMKGGKVFTGPRNAEGEPIVNIGTLSLHTAYEIHQGKGPVTMPAPGSKDVFIQETGGVTAGMALHKAEGIVPKGVRGDTEIPGLFAAGDAMATMQNGALYCPGGSLAGSSVTGAEAGVRAAEYISEVEAIMPERSEVEKAKATIYGPIERKGGYEPRWVIDQLRNLMFPYYITYIKKADRMEATLTMLAFYRDHMVPMLKANDAHELRLAHEVRNMVLNSEMKMRMALARKESRGMHYREDYPFRDDENFLCWITVKQAEDGTMEMGRVDIPKEWLPEDFDTMSYEERYPIRILNETMR